MNVPITNDLEMGGNNRFFSSHRNPPRGRRNRGGGRGRGNGNGGENG